MFASMNILTDDECLTLFRQVGTEIILFNIYQTFELYIQLFQNRVKGEGGKWKMFYNKKWELCAGKKYPLPKSELLSFRRSPKKNSQYEKEKKDAKVRTL